MKVPGEVLYEIVIASNNPSAIHALPVEEKEAALTVMYCNSPFIFINELIKRDEVDFVRWLEVVYNVRLNHYLGEAVSHGSLRVVEHLLSNDLSFDNTILRMIGVSGSVEVVKWMMDRGIYPDLETLIAAAEGGHYDLVCYLVEAGLPANSSVLEHALMGGHYDVVEYLDRIGTELEDVQPYITSLSTTSADMRIMRYLVSRGVEMTLSVLNYAVENSSLEIVKFIVGQGVQPTISTLLAAAKRGDVRIFQYIAGMVSPSDGVARVAASGGHLHMLRHMVESGYQLNQQVVNSAAMKGRIDVLEYLYSQGIVISPDTVSEAIFDRQYRVGDFALEHNIEIRPNAARIYMGHQSPEVVRYFEECGVVPTNTTLREAIKCYNVDTITYLIETGLRPTHDDLIEMVAMGNLDLIAFLDGMQLLTNDLLTAAVRSLELPVIDYIIDHQLGNDLESAIKYAIDRNSLKVVKHILERQRSIPAGPYDYAAARGVEIVRMIHARGGTFTCNAYYYAVDNNNASTVSFLDNINVPIRGTAVEERVVEKALLTASLDVVLLLSELGLDVRGIAERGLKQGTITQINHHPSVVMYILNICGDVHGKLLEAAIESCDYKTITMLLNDYRCCAESYCCPIADYNLIRLLIEHGRFTFNQRLCGQIVSRQRVDIVMLMIDSGLRDELRCVLKLAIRKGSLAVVKLIVDRGHLPFTVEDIELAKENGHQRIADFLLKVLNS